MDTMEIDDVMDVDAVESVATVSQVDVTPVVGDEKSTEYYNVLISDRNSFRFESHLFPRNRNIIKAKRRATVVPLSEPIIVEKLIVIDTNIFIHHLNDLKLIFARLSRNRKNCVNFVVPMIVLQELDGLKKGSAVSVKRAISFINEQLESKTMLFSDLSLINKCENSKTELKNREANDIEVYNNDDIIIEKCLLLKRLKSSDKSQVILLTNDVNLQNKALAVDLSFYSWKRFSAEFLSKNCDSEETSCFQEEVTSRKSPKKRKLSCNQLDNHIGPKVVKQFHGDNVKMKNETFEVKSIGVPKELDKKQLEVNNVNWFTLKFESAKKLSDNAKIKIQTVEVKSSGAAKEIGKQQKEIDNVDWLTLKYESEKKLRDFIESSLRREYGEKLWDKMFSENPKDGSLVDLLRLLKQGWIGVFSDAFDRNPRVNELVHKLLNSLSKSSKEEELKSELFSLMKFIPPENTNCDLKSNITTKKRKTT